MEWDAVKRLHQEALERDVSERSAFLDTACGGDEALRHEVESLLAYDTRAEAFMESPALEVAARSVSQEPSMPLVGRTLGHYRVESLLGAGGMGEVYLARDPRLDRSVALKILPPDLTDDPDRLQRFMREAKAASALSHPNVATIHDIGDSDGVRFIVMEYVEGQTLAEQTAGQPLAAAVIVDIAIQVADALEAAHAKGITHRDIKPTNLMRTPRGQVKVLDFGVAKTTSRESPTQTSAPVTGSETAAGVVIGSAPYMSPEQVLGRAVDPRSDLFSLGVTLYELATGARPFSGATPLETMGFILHGEPQSIASLNDAIPSMLERIIVKLLEKDVARRYQSARDLVADLRHLQSNADRSRVPLESQRRRNLPAQLTSFVGRQREIGDVRRLLAHNRLVTLTGAGGCGKTRLALQVANEVVDQFGDGVWMVDLAPLSEPDLVTNAVASVLRVQEGSERSIVEVLSDYLRSRQLLLVLDNCEHLIAACAGLAETLLQAAPDLRILATSREALGIPGETVWRVPSLSLPDEPDARVADTLLQYEAPRLFTERARAVAPAFAVTAANAGTVAQICDRLDGIPLAIELAAARLKMLSLEQINERLNDRFRLLTGGSRTALARQRTLEATVDWSYDLLSATERRLLCRLSVFAGGWTLEAAEAVCAGDGIRATAMLDLLSHLVDKSLVVNEQDPSGTLRYRFLETVRQYGRERLLRSGRFARVRDRHLAFYFEFAGRAEPHLSGPDQVMWLDRLQAEHDNLRTALEWCLSKKETSERALQTICAVWPFWNRRNHFSEGRQWVERALVASPDAAPPIRARAFVAAADLSYFQADYAAVNAYADRVLALDEADLGAERWTIAFALFAKAIVAVDQGELEDSIGLAEHSLSISRQTGAAWVGGLARIPIALAAAERGDLYRARRLLDEAVAVFRSSGDKWALTILLVNVSHVLLHDGQFDQAAAVAREGLALCRETGDRRSLTWCLTQFAAAMALQQQPARAAWMWGAVERISQSIGSPIPAMVLKTRFRNLPAVCRALGEEAFAAAYAQGAQMTPDAAIAYALGENESEERL